MTFSELFYNIPIENTLLWVQGIARANEKKNILDFRKLLRSDLDTDKGSADNTGLGCAGSDFGRLGQPVLVLCAAEFLFMKTFVGLDFITAVSFILLTFFVFPAIVVDFVVDLVMLWNNTCDNSNFSLFDMSCSFRYYIVLAFHFWEGFADPLKCWDPLNLCHRTTPIWSPIIWTLTTAKSLGYSHEAMHSSVKHQVFLCLPPPPPPPRHYTRTMSFLQMKDRLRSFSSVSVLLSNGFSFLSL